MRQRHHLAGVWIRAAAASIDAAVGLAATFALASTLGIFFARRAVVTLRIGQPGTLWTGPIPLLLGTIGEVVYLLPFTLWLVWMVDPLTGASVGKRVCGLRVGEVDGRPATWQRRWARHAVQTAGLWGWTLALLAGRWEIAVLASVAGVVMWFGALGALCRSRAALHDRLSGSRVWRL